MLSQCIIALKHLKANIRIILSFIRDKNKNKTITISNHEIKAFYIVKHTPVGVTTLYKCKTQFVKM